MSVGLLLLLQFAGLPNGTTGQIFELIGVTFNEDNSINSSTTSASDYFDVLFRDTGDSSLAGILVTIGSAIGAVAIGLFTRARLENLILLPFITGTLVLFISAFISIINYSISQGVPWIAALISIIFVPFTVGFIISLGEFFRGTD